MKEAKEALCEFCKEISRGMIHQAPEKSLEFTHEKKVMPTMRVKCVQLEIWFFSAFHMGSKKYEFSQSFHKQLHREFEKVGS